MGQPLSKDNNNYPYMVFNCTFIIFISLGENGNMILMAKKELFIISVYCVTQQSCFMFFSMSKWLRQMMKTTFIIVIKHVVLFSIVLFQLLPMFDISTMILWI